MLDYRVCYHHRKWDLLQTYCGKSWFLRDEIKVFKLYAFVQLLSHKLHKEVTMPWPPTFLASSCSSIQTSAMQLLFAGEKLFPKLSAYTAGHICSRTLAGPTVKMLFPFWRASNLDLRTKGSVSMNIGVSLKSFLTFAYHFSFIYLF